MILSLFLSKLIGLSLVFTCLSVLINNTIYQRIAKDVLNMPLMLIVLGELDIILGLLIILFHNVWVWNWQVLITLLGWFIIIRGVIRVLFPQQVLAFATKLINSDHFFKVLNLIAGLFLLIGLFLTYKGFAG